MKILFNPNMNFNFYSKAQMFKKQNDLSNQYSQISENDYRNYNNAIKNINSVMINFKGIPLSEEKKDQIIELYKQGLNQVSITKVHL